MSGKVKLAVSFHGSQAQDIVFDQHDTFLFGRMKDCHICLPRDQKVSRHHFILEVNPPDARVRDLGSLNGTYVNGVKHGGRSPLVTPEEAAKHHYPEVNLHDGDEIVVGDTVMKLLVEGANAVQESVFCLRCGRDVSSEVGPARSGDYICNACRAQQQNDPIPMLMDIIRHARPRKQQDVLQIPDFEIEKKLGEGGMGAVYLARHRTTGRYAALKVMLSQVAVDEHAREIFMREVETTRVLKHKNIVEFYDQGSSGSIFYFLLEYCDGGSVADLMKRRGGRLKLDDAVPIIAQTLEGLAYAHASNFVHRDLKPHNILLRNDRHLIAKMADMGLSKNFAQAGLSGLTATGNIAGSFAFMSREQLTDFKRSQPVSDVWAMGATFYNMITGFFPRDFRAGQDPIDMILNNEIIPVRKRDPQIPSSIANVIDRSLTNHVQERYKDAKEMLRALKAIV
jgi:hypothetical protein